MERNRTLTSGQYFGTITRLQTTGGIQLCETSYPAHQIMPNHSHELSFFCYVLQGAFTETRHNHSLHCEPGTVIFHPPGDLHSDRVHDKPSRCFNIEFAKGIFSETLSTAHPWNSHSLEPTFIVRRMFREFRNPDSLSGLAIEGLSFELIAASIRESKNRSHGIPKWLQKVRKDLHENFMQNFSFKEVALNAGVHQVHLARSFRKFYGTTVAEYVRGLRVQHACKLLASNHSVSEVAVASGFCDQSHFTKVFRRLTGMTRAQFRRLC